MKALILVADGFEDSEFFYPYYRLLEENIEVHVAGPDAGKVVGKHGYEFETNQSLVNVQADDYDMLVLPGGKAPEKVRMVPEAVNTARRMIFEGKLVAAICHGAQTLISANVLRGREATCWPAIRDDLKAAGASYVDKEVVVDDNLVTSRCPADLPAFCRAILAKARQTV